MSLRRKAIARERDAARKLAAGRDARQRATHADRGSPSNC